MTKIPTPFIGGSNGPLRPSEDDQRLEPPFVPVDEPQVAAEPEPPPSETARADAPIRIPVEEAEPSEPGSEPSEAFEREKPEGEAASEAASEPLREEMQLSETEAAAELASEVTRATQEAERAAGGLDLPDFLVASDTPALEARDAPAEPEAETVPAEALPEGAETEARIAETASELGRGRFGPWIARLSSELGAYGVEAAVRRAFAAGYLAGKREKE